MQDKVNVKSKLIRRSSSAAFALQGNDKTHVTELMGCADGLVRILCDVTPSLSRHHFVCWSNQDEFVASTFRGDTNQRTSFCSSDSAQPYPPA